MVERAEDRRRLLKHCESCCVILRRQACYLHNDTRPACEGEDTTQIFSFHQISCEVIVS